MDSEKTVQKKLSFDYKFLFGIIIFYFLFRNSYMIKQQ